MIEPKDIKLIKELPFKIRVLLSSFVMWSGCLNAAYNLYIFILNKQDSNFMWFCINFAIAFWGIHMLNKDKKELQEVINANKLIKILLDKEK